MTTITQATPRPVLNSVWPTAIPAPSCPARIVVPVDGSPVAERALPVAAWLAREIAVPLHLLEVVPHPGDAVRAIHYLDGLARRFAAGGWGATRGDDPAAAILAAGHAGSHGLACLATHGRDRDAALLGSVATAVLDRTTQPVVLVGPHARPPCAADAPVVVAIDGSPGERQVVEVAAGWADRLGRDLVVAAVTDHDRSSAPGRTADLATYAARLAKGGESAGCGVSSLTVHDPSMRHGLVRLVDRTAALLVAGAHRHTLRPDAPVGSHTARIVHDVAVPALLVPLGAGDLPGASAVTWYDTLS